MNIRSIRQLRVTDSEERETQRLQRTLFHEKQKIIENCLFGVDINPNSVKICRLRLWIELLKNAYYKPPAGAHHSREGGISGDLETLPNIDINDYSSSQKKNRRSRRQKRKSLPPNLQRFGRKLMT
ncbi:MAG: hypothetical protein IPM96_21105 [Ignavibacteria bacterium]|nr:hypothetical protein [Ignavibacteria bacterium]